MGMSPQQLRQTKGETTRALILEAAVQQASEGGFESITIGSLAERTKLSKSGLFAHFGSRQELQIAAMDEASRRFTEAVFMPALKSPRGLRRLRALFEGWVHWPEIAQLSGSCPLYAAAAEYNDKPGPIRDAVVERQELLARELAKTVRMAVETGELAVDTDPEQFAFEIHKQPANTRQNDLGRPRLWGNLQQTELNRQQLGMLLSFCHISVEAFNKRVDNLRPFGMVVQHLFREIPTKTEETRTDVPV